MSDDAERLGAIRAAIASEVVKVVDALTRGKSSYDTMEVFRMLSDFDRIAGKATVDILSRAAGNPPPKGERN